MQITPRIIYRTIYITIPVYVPAARRVAAQRITVMQQTAEPESKKKLEELKKKIDAILSKLDQVPPAIRRKIQAAVDSMLNMAASGDVGGALNVADATTDLTNKAVEAGQALKAMIKRAKGFVSTLGGPAGAAMAKIVALAEDAYTNATNLTAIGDVTATLERAVNLAKKMLSVPKNSKDYAVMLAELQRMAGGMPTHKRENDPMGDRFALGKGLLLAAMDRTQDPKKLERLVKLHELVSDLQNRVDELPPGLKEAVAERMEALVARGAEGDEMGAIKDANEAIGFADQALKIDRVLDPKFDRLNGLAAKLQGPEGELIGKLLEKLQRVRQECGSPQELQAVDAILMKAVETASRLGSLPPGDPQRGRLAMALKQLQKMLDRRFPEDSPFDCDHLAIGAQRPGHAPGGPGEIDVAVVAEVDFGMIAALIGDVPGAEPSPKRPGGPGRPGSGRLGKPGGFPPPPQRPKTDRLGGPQRPDLKRPEPPKPEELIELDRISRQHDR